MRRFARLAAASIVIILGLALVAAAAFNPETGRITLPTPRNEPKEEPPAKAIPPFDPEARLADHPGIPQSLRPNSFDSEFGKRGKHKVEVSVRGGAVYGITWRDKSDTEWGVGNVEQNRTVNSGFPIVQVGMSATRGIHSTCVITIDGQEKDTQSTDDETPVAFCEA